jgi:hypothetical protein
MSSQGLNATAYSGFFYNLTVGTPKGFTTRDAGDYTRRLKQAALYRDFLSKATTTGSSTAYNNMFTSGVDYSIAQSNENRLTYQFGEVVCINGGAGCVNGPFPTNPLGT